MIKIVEKNLFESDANIIVHQVNAQGVMGSGVALQVANYYPHVEREYLKYVKHCKKNKIQIMGTVQYVPIESWALIMVDTIKNQRLERYDNDYKYIANAFGQNDYGYDGQTYTDLNSLRKALMDIKLKAESLNAKIALPYKLGSFRGGANWDDVYKIICDIFENSEIDVEICRYDRG